MEVYNTIWKELNQVHLNNSKKNINNYPTQFNSQEVEQYFASNSSYKIIYLRSLNEEDQQFIDSMGISLEYLQFNEYLQLNRVRLMTLAGEKLEKLNKSSKLKQANHTQNKFLWKQVLNTDYDLSVVNDGYIDAICPYTGEILHSNKSFIFAKVTFCYRFVGKEVFYLITGGCDNEKLCFYFPHEEVLINICKSPKFIDKAQLNAITINRWKARMVTSWQQLKSYICYQKQPSLAALIGLEPISTAHHIYNDLSGLQKIVESKLLHKIDTFLVVAKEFYGGIDEIFPEIDPTKIKRVSLNTHSKEIVDNNYFTLQLCDFWVNENLANRIYQTSVKKCSSNFLDTLELLRKEHFPLLWINFRLGKRTWFSQVEGIANIIKSLYATFPRLGVVFDGSSRIDVKGKLFIDEGLEAAIKKEKETLKQIKNILPSQIKVYDIIGKPMYEVIAWAKAIDLYLAPFGGGLVKVISIANKPGVVHSNQLDTYMFSLRGHNLYSLRRQNSVVPVYVPHNYITDALHDDYSKSDPINRSYECDWKGAYEELLKITDNLQNQR